MTDDKISRPKVRFCQLSNNARNTETVEHCKGEAIVQENDSGVKEFVSFNKPVRIVESIKSTSIYDKDVYLSNCNIDTALHRNYIISGNVGNTSFSDKDAKIENTMIQRNINNIQNTENCKILQLDKSLRDDTLKSRMKHLKQKNKENKSIPLKRDIFKKNVYETKTRKSQYTQSGTQEKYKLSTDGHTEKVTVKQAFKEPEVTKLQSVPRRFPIMKRTRNSMIQERILNSKPITTLSSVASRYKTVPKNKISPVKKIILRNVLSPKIKTSVGPGVFRKKQNDINEKQTVISDVIVEDLLQPEYNSIVYTINKLKKLEQQRSVTNINHLPSMLKNFLNGKISMALDFPLDEAIYKNLIDLSIDERQLPSTITRSKDPEPRQKDTVPKLSNFFIPEDTTDICEAMHIKHRASKIDNNWNAFKISDRILEWKYTIDDIY